MRTSPGCTGGSLLVVVNDFTLLWLRDGVVTLNMRCCLTPLARFNGPTPITLSIKFELHSLAIAQRDEPNSSPAAESSTLNVLRAVHADA